MGCFQGLRWRNLKVVMVCVSWKQSSRLGFLKKWFLKRVFPGKGNPESKIGEGEAQQMRALLRGSSPPKSSQPDLRKGQTMLPSFGKRAEKLVWQKFWELWGGVGEQWWMWWGSLWGAAGQDMLRLQRSKTTQSPGSSKWQKYEIASHRNINGWFLCAEVTRFPGSWKDR